MFLITLFLFFFNLQSLAADTDTVVNETSGNAALGSKIEDLPGITIHDILLFLVSQREKVSIVTSSRSYLPLALINIMLAAGLTALGDGHERFINHCPANMSDLAGLDYGSTNSLGINCAGGAVEIIGGSAAIFWSWFHDSTWHKKLNYYFDQISIGFHRSPDELANLSDFSIVIDELIESKSALLNKLTADQLFVLMRTKHRFAMIDLFDERHLQHSAMRKLIKVSNMTPEELAEHEDDVLKLCREEKHFSSALLLLLKDNNKLKQINSVKKLLKS